MQFTSTLIASLALVSSLAFAAPARNSSPNTSAVETVRIQLDGNNPKGEDARQHEVKLDNEPFLTGKRGIVGAQILEGNGNCRLYSDKEGNVSLNKKFGTEFLEIDPAVTVQSVRCSA